MAPRAKTGRVTIKTVAEDAGVSVAAVSKVLRDAYGVSEALRAKVQASMEKLGYRPHAAARGMRGQTYTLGMILPDIHNPFFTDIVAGVNTALERTPVSGAVGIGQSSDRDRAVADRLRCSTARWTASFSSAPASPGRPSMRSRTASR